MKKYLALGIAILSFPLLGSAATVLFPQQGGTGISTTTAGNIGNCLKVLSVNPLVYQLGSCGSGGGTPGGSTTQIQFNDAGAFGGDSNFTWDKTAASLYLYDNPSLNLYLGTTTATQGVGFTVASADVLQLYSEQNSGAADFDISGLTGERSFTFPDRAGTFAVSSTAPIVLSNGVISCPTCGAGSFTTTTISAGANTLSSTAYTFASSTDTNLGITIGGSGPTLTFTPVWIGTLADGRIASAATWNAKQNALTFPLPFASTTHVTIAAGNGVSVSTLNGTSTITNTQPHVTSTIIAGGGTATGNAFTYATSSAGINQILCGTSTCTWSNTPSSTWGLVPAARNVNTTSPLAGGGALSGDLTLTCTTCQLQASSTLNTLIGPWTIAGTTNQVNVASSSNPSKLTLSTPQNIDTAANVQFASVTSTQIKSTNQAILATGGGNVGVGTTTPAKIFTVASSTSGAEMFSVNTNTSTSTLQIGDVGIPACLIMRDKNDGGFSYCTIQSGTLTCNTTACN
jgi:hypothetical protein